MSLVKKYLQMSENSVIKKDAAQMLCAEKLGNLLDEFIKWEGYSQRSVLHKTLSKSKLKKPKGLYIFGEVGRGKSMLMDLFFDNIDTNRKRRVHFHSFMLEIHNNLFKWREATKDKPNEKDPIPKIAKDIAKDFSLLCFDEMQVTDIADAMLLGRLFKELFKNNVVVVTTSNRAPDELYKNGLQRERFLPFIAIIKKELEIFELAAEEDYRLSHLKSLKTVYFTPLGKKADEFMENTFCELTGEVNAGSAVLDVGGRKLVIQKACGSVAWVNFANMCAEARGAQDYIELAKSYGTVLLSGIPKMSKEQRNEAKRFVTLIDELYEHKVKLICTAEVLPDKIYPSGDGSFEFARTVSRLIEMQSGKYLEEGHVV